MPFLDTPDTIICQLTKEGRSLLARAKLGDVVYRVLGWQLGCGGYEDGESTTPGIASSQTLTVVGTPSNGDYVVVGGQSLVAVTSGADGTTQFNIGATTDETAFNLATAFNLNSSLALGFVAEVSGSLVTISCRTVGVFGNFITIQTNSPAFSLGGSTLTGGAGSPPIANPLKVKPFNDTASEASASILLTDNNFVPGDEIILNGKPFAVNVDWLPGPSIAATVKNIRAAILNSKDSRHYRIVYPIIDPLVPENLILNCLITGEIGNSFPVSAIDLTTPNFQVTPMSGGSSITLDYPSYPVPPTLGQFFLPDGRIEQPDSTSVSFVMRVPEGTSGMQGYGECGIWVEVERSNFSPEVGRRVLFAFAHFPLQAKNDRMLYTVRVILKF